jgi:hypothetical protein
MVAYWKRMAKFSIKLPLSPQDELFTLFKELQVNIVVKPKRTQPCNSWISAPTWALINKRATLRQQGKLPQWASHLIGQQIADGLKGDRQQQTASVVETIEGHLASREMKEARRCLKGWYTATFEAAPAASPMLVAPQTAKRVALYGGVPPPGAPLSIHVAPVNIPDGPPSNGELWDTVRGLRNGRATGASGLQAEHIKVWLSDVVCKKEEDSDVGLGNKWRTFVRLMQAVWEQGCVPKQMRWEIIVLFPMGGNDYCGIGLLEPFWKVVEKIMVAQFLSIKFHFWQEERGLPRLRRSSTRAWPGTINAPFTKSI